MSCESIGDAGQNMLKRGSGAVTERSGPLHTRRLCRTTESRACNLSSDSRPVTAVRLSRDGRQSLAGSNSEHDRPRSHKPHCTRDANAKSAATSRCMSQHVAASLRPSRLV